MAVAKLKAKGSIESSINIPSFFGDCDKKDHSPHGEIVNTNPLWTKDKQISDMRDAIDDIKREEDSGLFVSPKARARKMKRKKELEKTLREIKASDPVGKVRGKDLDAVRSTKDSFVEEIKNINLSVEDSELALKGRSSIDPSRMGHNAKAPCIKLKTEEEVKIAQACNMKIQNGMVSRDDMTRGIWMLERVLGIRPDHTRLKHYRKPGSHIGKSNQVLVPELPADMTK